MSKFITTLKLAAVMVMEVGLITYPVAALTFWLAYLGDICLGQHLMVNTADKWFAGCLFLGLGCGLVYTIWRTKDVIDQLRGNKAPNQEVK